MRAGVEGSWEASVLQGILFGLRGVDLSKLSYDFVGLVNKIIILGCRGSY